jgi:hypothetical protein
MFGSEPRCDGHGVGDVGAGPRAVSGVLQHEDDLELFDRRV